MDKKDPRDVMQAEETARITQMFADRAAPAEMPTDEQIEAEILPMTYDGADLTECVARVKALFAPILAGKERKIVALQQRFDEKNDAIGSACVRLAAAEAALAAEREVNAVLSKKLEIALAGLQRVSDMAPKAAAAIRAAEDDLGLGEVVGSRTS
ncbi:MAG: hypothetical protein J0I42_15185 [Bosea sp.]|uniref:hypothetical protein n=1 Tax=Bosea sp. (in: a-proteobacteria) TaxID=1871050 RepID=UPI001AD28146|nr:hypothetical protein [Bosea sp. (in: a-proteobacteria)]MBN9453291.1 hypothetical protein [Bosea sp. (in: a-proteobacteria)]